jgi:hypothetical protein
VLDDKTCNLCGEKKDLAEFPWRNINLNKKMNFCKPCNSARQKTSYLKNIEKNRALAKERYQKNKDKFKKIAKIYRLNNREKIKKSLSKWASNNKDVMRLHRAKRKAVTRGATAKKITKKEITRIKNSACIYCGKKENIQIEHVVPISRGGLHSIGNIASACAPCNQSKKDKYITEWRYKNARQS